MAHALQFLSNAQLRVDAKKGLKLRIIPQFSALNEKFSRCLLDSADGGSCRELALLYISSWDFDSDWYLSSNPDLSEAIPTDVFPSGWHHFTKGGFFEGRAPVEAHVDDEWYMNHYSDVASAILDGVFANAREHYVKLGRAEGRVPCDPEVDPEWYAKRYIEGPESLAADHKVCTEHFVRFGYLNGAIPAPPR